MSEQPDDMHPAQRVYALSVVAADAKYRIAVQDAKRIRQIEIDEALRACELALEGMTP